MVVTRSLARASSPLARIGASPNDAHQRLVAWLSQPQSYPGAVTKVDVIETHISWVFLTDRYAYKLKKPLRFDFLDFSTPAARRAACQAELDLNRRLAADVYLDVLPITRSRRGEFELEGKGPAVDWVVKMRRLPDERCFERRLRDRQASAPDVRRISEMLCDFYDRLPPLAMTTSEYNQRFIRHVQANREELLRPEHHLPEEIVRRVHAAQLRYLQLCPGMLDQRVLDGRIVDGHGDLRPEHIYLTTPAVAIDCIEFNAEYRQIDVADELAFLAMECERVGEPQIGQAIIDAYVMRSGDSPNPQLLTFYKSYRAGVRAKVAAIASRQQDPSNEQPDELAQRYLELADQYAQQLGPPILVVVTGLMGSGKSTLAAEIAAQLGARHLQTDAIRRELHGICESQHEFGEGKYASEMKAQVYKEMFRREDALLRRREPLVLDGTFLTNELRRNAVAIGEKNGALVLLVRCECPAQVAAQRIAARRLAGDALSEARPELIASQKREEETLSAELPALTVDTQFPPTALWEIVRRRLQRFCCINPRIDFRETFVPRTHSHAEKFIEKTFHD